MGIAEQIAAYSAEMLRRLKEENNQPPPPKVAEAEQTIAEFEQGNRDREVQARRLVLPPQSPEDCPACHSHGRSVQMRPQTRDDDSEYVRCRECGLEIDL